MSDKTVEEVLDFIQKLMDNAEGRAWDEYESLVAIKDYIESRRSELTSEEVAQMKPKTNIQPVTRREVDEDEINGE